MFEPMTRERLETIFETFKRDALIAGIAPPDWDKTIERVRDMAIEALRQADKAMTPEQLEARNKRINRLSLDLWDVYTDNDPEASTKNNRVWDLLLAFHNTVANDQSAEITRLTAALEEAENGPLTPKVIAELIRGKAARMGRLEEMQENTRFYSDGDWSVTPGNIPRPTKPCVVLRLTEDEAAAIRAMTEAYNG